MMPHNPYLAPQSPSFQPDPEDALLVEARALRIAGAFILAGAFLNIASLALCGASAIHATYSRGWLSIVFDLWIGGSLLAKNFGVRTWAIIRAAIGALVVGVVPMMSGNIADGVLGLASCAAILLLVLPGAGRIRIGIASVLYGVAALVAVLGIAFLATHPAQ